MRSAALLVTAAWRRRAQLALSCASAAVRAGGAQDRPLRLNQLRRLIASEAVRPSARIASASAADFRPSPSASTFVSACGRFHVDGATGLPLYAARFQQVQSLHWLNGRRVAAAELAAEEPGCRQEPGSLIGSPAPRAPSACHVDSAGLPLYPHRFRSTFGF